MTKTRREKEAERHRRRRREMSNAPLPTTIKEDFMGWVDIIPDTGCWEWALSRNKKRGGYGQKNINYQVYKSHRLSWMAFKGDIPEGMYVCHKCDNPPCCNPDHLFLGTPQDNVVDAWSKGRLSLPSYIPRGEKALHSKLTKDKVLKIREKFDLGENVKALALEFSVTKQTIYKIGARKSWKHLQ